MVNASPNKNSLQSTSEINLDNSTGDHYKPVWQTKLRSQMEVQIQIANKYSGKE